MDVLARTIAPRLSERMGQSIVIDNKPGAAGTVAMDALKQAPADGYTLIINDTAVAINPIIQPNLTYRPLRDLQVVSNLASTGLILAVNPTVPASDVKGLVAYAKANPQNVNFSSPGVGTVPHMAGELFNARSGTKAVHIPYKGGSAAVADLLSGRIQMVFFTPSVVLPYIKDGRVRALAYTGAQRSISAPELPTMAEAGIRNFEANVWLVLSSTRGTPPEVISRLNAAVTEVMKRDDIKAALAKYDIQSIGSSVDEAQKVIAQDEKNWSEVVRTNNIKPEQ